MKSVGKVISCLLLALVLALSITPAWATETEAGTESATVTEDPYIKNAEDDSSEAGELQWYRDNSPLLENNTVIKSALRSIGWDVTKLVCKLANVSETLYNKTFGLIDMTNYPQINALLDTLKPVLAALTVLCCVWLGILMMQKHEKPPLIRNLLLGIVAVSASAYLFSMANNMVISFRSGVLGGEDINQSYALVNSNLIDLVNVDLQGDIDALNYKAGTGILYGADIDDAYDMDAISLNDTLDWHTKKNGKDLYGWSSDFNNKIKFRLRHTSDGDVTEKIYDGLTTANIGNAFYYRYSFDFWGCLLQLLSLVLLFLALCYKNIRIAYELVVSRLMAYLFSADVGGGEKLKNTLLFVRDTYITMAVCVLSVKLYEIMVGAITSFGLNGLGKGLASVFVAYAVIDGPNLVERILGMDAGLSSSMGRAMAIFGAGKAVARGSAHMGSKTMRGIKNTAMAAATGTTLRQRQAKGSPGEQLGRKLYRKKQSEKSTDPLNAERQSAPSADPAAEHKPESTTVPIRPMAEPASHTAAEGSAPIQTPTESGSTANVRFSPDFMDESRSSDTNAAPPAPKPQRVSNPAFSAAVKRLSPGPDASEAERKDFNRQMNAIVRGKKHQAIQPDEDAKPYQVKNYEKAKQLEQAYHSYAGPKPDRKGKVKEDKAHG